MSAPPKSPPKSPPKKPPASDGPASEGGAAPKPLAQNKGTPQKVPEIGGPEGPEPTRYGDWERKGRCIDF